MSYAKHFRRSPSSVRNKYQRITNAEISKCKNKCKACGKPRRGHVCYKEIQNRFEQLPEYVYRADFTPLLEGDDEMKFDFEDISRLWAWEDPPEVTNVRLVLSGCQTSIRAKHRDMLA